MNQTKPNTESSNITLAEHYRAAFETKLNELSKETRPIFLQRLAEPPQIIRGVEAYDPQVSKFIREVVSLGESNFVAQEKKTRP